MTNPWVIDGLVVLVYFVVIISIGLYKGRGEKSMEGFAVGDRNIPWWAVLASIMAAEVSAATFLGTPGEGYSLLNFSFCQLALGTALARVVVAYLFIRRFYDLRVVSIYEFLETRFGRSTKLASSAVFLVTRALASGSRMFVPAILLVVAWQLIKDVHPNQGQTLMLYAGAVGLLTLFTAIYTTFGGIKAVVWTDLLQVVLMFGAMTFATVTLWHAVGGWDAVKQKIAAAPVDPALVEDRASEITKEAGGTLPPGAAEQRAWKEVQSKALTFWDWGIVEGNGLWKNVKHVLETEYTGFAALIASVFITMATHGTDQDMVQRMLTAKDVRRSRRSLILSGLADIPVSLSFAFIGILLWVFYHMPANEARRPGSDYFVNFILRELPAGLRGVMAAGLFATAMGSLSTALNALATSFTRDFYLGIFRPGATQRQQMVAARWSTAFFALLLTGIGVGTAWMKLTHPQVRIIPIVLGSFGYTYGSLLGIFLVGMTTRRRGSPRGNLIAMLAGFVFVAYMSDLPNDVARMFGRQIYEIPVWQPKLAFPWWISFGAVATYAVAVLFRTPEERVVALEKQVREQREKDAALPA